MKTKQFNLLVGLTIVFCLSCEQQNTDLTNALKSNLKDKDSGLRTSISNSSELFTDPCDRHVFNPCDYSNNGNYEADLFFELNHQINDCLLTSVYACGNEETCCHPVINIDMSYLEYTDFPKLPFLYCLERTNCDSFYCQSAGGWLNVFGNIELQDWMLSKALERADDNRPSCTYFGQPAVIESIQFMGFVQRFRCTGNDPTGCFNTHMYIRVTYFCNDCGSES